MINLPNQRIPWDRQVRPARKWLAKGLSGLYVANSRTLNLVNSAMSGSLSAPTTAIVSPSGGIYGLGLKTGSTSDYWTIPTIATKEYTLLAVVSDAADGSIGQLIDDDDGVTRVHQFRLAAAGGSADFIAFNTGVSAFTASTGSIGGARQDLGVVCIARMLGSEAKVWATGTTPGTATVTGTPMTRNTTARVAQRKAGVQGSTGRFHIVADFVGGLPESDVLTLLNNPQDLFEPISIPVWIAAAAGGASNAPRYYHRTQMGMS